MLRKLIEIIRLGRNLAFDEAAAAIDAVISGSETDAVVMEFLVELHRKGESATEAAGAAAALRRRMRKIEHGLPVLIDTCGTGGDGAQTFNISTAAAIVTAAAGVPVAKHGNRAATSRSGSADVLRSLGVNVEAELPVVERCLAELGVCFCFAPLWHPAMRQVAEIRRRIPHPTIFNIIGPLTNPAGAPYQLIGAGRRHLHELLPEALSYLGTRRACVVHGCDGLDEVTLSGPTSVEEVGEVGRRRFDWVPEQFGLDQHESSSIRVADAESSAAVIRGVLEGRRGPARDYVVVNAAAAVLIAGAAISEQAAATMAAEAIDSGRARELLAGLVALTTSR